MYDVSIIGAGIIGTFIARELSRYDLKINLIDKENDVANGTTKANSAIIHAGYDAKPGTLMAKFNASGNPLFDHICGELDVPFKRIGSLVVAFNKNELNTLSELYQRGLANKIPDLKILDKKEVLEREPYLSKDVTGALYAPGCGIIGPWELAIALAENAIENGVELFLNNEILGITKQNNTFHLATSQQEIKSKVVINCSGVYTDKINDMVCSPRFSISPRKGEYFILDKNAGAMVNHVIFQCPGQMGKGILLTPTVHGNIIIGPNAEDTDNKQSLHTSQNGLEYVRKMAKKSVPDIPFDQTITTFAGLRAEPDTGDFIIKESVDTPGFINVAGTKSPGLSSAPSIATFVIQLVDHFFDGLVKKNFNPKRRPTIHFQHLDDKSKQRVIEKDPRYGKIICRCESITEGEIVDAIHRKAGARTVDGIKKRVRPGMGRCQGGFCLPRVIDILARELDEKIENIVKDNHDSFLLTGKTKRAN